MRLTAELIAPFARQPLMQPWLAQLERLIPDVLRDWNLRPDGVPTAGQTAVVLPVRTDTAEITSLTFGWPHPKAAHEHLALRAWAGRGAVRLLRADRTVRSYWPTGCPPSPGADPHRPALRERPAYEVAPLLWTRWPEALATATCGAPS